jgi:hypothetical protein
MSEPFTREKCGICGYMFEVPMVKIGVLVG